MPSSVASLRACGSCGSGIAARFTGSSSDGSQRWLNWVLRHREDGLAVGTVQATVRPEQDGPVAEVAWVIAAAFQGRGYAREAAQVMVSRLREDGPVTVRAHVHPAHAASQSAARAVGMSETATLVDGEVRWQT